MLSDDVISIHLYLCHLQQLEVETIELDSLDKLLIIRQASFSVVWSCQPMSKNCTKSMNPADSKDKNLFLVHSTDSYQTGYEQVYCCTTKNKHVEKRGKY